MASTTCVCLLLIRCLTVERVKGHEIDNLCKSLMGSSSVPDICVSQKKKYIRILNIRYESFLISNLNSELLLLLYI